MSVISGTIGAVLGSQAQQDASERSLQAARETNEANYRIFKESRGANGNAFLPLYFGNKEQQLADDASNFYDQSRTLFGSPSSQLQKYNQTIGQYQPMVDAAKGTLGDAFNGNLLNARLGYAKPVADARTAVAATQKQGVLEGLQERLNALNAASAKSGYTGTGSFAQNRLLGATIGARQQAAAADASAQLANATDVRSIYDQNADLKLKLMDQPFQQAQQSLYLQMLPMSQVQQNFSRSLAPFEFFRMGQGNFQYAPLPQQPVIPSAAQIAMTGIGAANQQLGNYFAQQQQNQYVNSLQNQAMSNYISNLDYSNAGLGYGTEGWGAALSGMIA